MKYLIFSLAICTTLLAFPAVAAEQPGLTCDSAGVCSYTPLEPLPCPAGSPDCQTGKTDFPALVGAFFKVLFSLGALIAVGQLVVGGIMYMTSEVVDRKTEARRRISSAIFGLLLLAGSWLILYTINPQLLQFDFILPSTTVAGGTPSPSSGGGTGILLETDSSGIPVRLMVKDSASVDEAAKNIASFTTACTGVVTGKGTVEKGTVTLATDSRTLSAGTYTYYMCAISPATPS